MSYLELAKKIQAGLKPGAADPTDQAPAAGNSPSGLTAQDIIDIDAGNVVAVLIDSTMVGGPLWFAFSDNWRPDEADDTPIFYASELPFLREMSADELRRRYADKKALGGGWIRDRADEPTRH